MQIQLNSDKHITGSPGLQERVEQILEQELKHLSDRVTRIEVHLNDVNSGKAGDDDKRCQLEARLAGTNPISVEHRAENVELALRGAGAAGSRSVQCAGQGGCGRQKTRIDTPHGPQPGGVDIVLLPWRKRCSSATR